jgi:hypothetical protein
MDMQHMRTAPWSFLGGIVLGATVAGGAIAGPTLPSPDTYYVAAVRGDPDAQATLGRLYAKGQGARRSDARAFQWLWRAAEQGHAGAQLELSRLFEAGKGVAQHFATAYKWARLAQANASEPATAENAGRLIDQLTSRMSELELAEARRRADDWQPKLEARSPRTRATATSPGAGSSGPAPTMADSSPVRKHPASQPDPAAADIAPAGGGVYPDPDRRSRWGARHAARAPAAVISRDRAGAIRSFRRYVQARLMRSAHRRDL